MAAAGAALYWFARPKPVSDVAQTPYIDPKIVLPNTDDPLGSKAYALVIARQEIPQVPTTYLKQERSSLPSSCYTVFHSMVTSAKGLVFRRISRLNLSGSAG